MAVNNTPSDKEKVVECLESSGATLTSAQQDWINDTTNTVKIKQMATYIKNIGCNDMSNIIQDFIDNPSPNFNEYADQIIECIELNKLTENAYFTNAITNLKSDVDDEDQEKEKGYNMYKNNDVITITEVPIEDTGETYTNYTLTNSFFGGIHMHQENGLFPMFSATDIMLLGQFNQIYSPFEYHQHEVIHVLVTTNGVYAIKIKNYNNLLGFVGAYNSDSRFKERVDLLSERYFYKEVNNITGANTQTSTEYQNNFLKFVNQDFNLGITFFELSDDLQTWTKKTLDTNNNTVPTNCN
ncbi:hypothetical protein KO494_02270 [Lacinutrix sp. C3R15]|uniref:hypothetical protein n=1 Tax=Flavobacteriaceae TaxID=49546 RepID=UPI001C09CAA4|nr:MULTISPECIES: hypothetical protein [Flavobacteriaceae]MBU2938355.1 hypothetical protein [Lacinutrix sp. C3R15]MDO6621670.1 hypothetical protein [Oceanihabitans sp. 1_MG-2023]